MTEPTRCPANGKVQFPTNSAARQWAQKYAKASHDRRPNPYLCDQCKTWHLTSHGNKVGKSIRRNRRPR